LWPDAKPQIVLEEASSEDYTDSSEEEEDEAIPITPPDSDENQEQEGSENDNERENEGPADEEEEQSPPPHDENFMQQVAEDDFMVQARIGLARFLSAVQIDEVILSEPDWYRWCILSSYIRSFDDNIHTALRTSGERLFNKR
jgi:cobalamin biosynthesis protein CobT